MASTLKTNAIEPEGGTTNMVVGESGQNTVIGSNDIRANVLQDSGGNAIFTSDGSGNLSGVSSDFGGAWVMLSTQTASNSASISFTSGITSTYKEYIFKCYNINPATDQAEFQFQVNATDGADYNDSAITSSFWRQLHAEDDSQTGLGYDDGFDLSQVTTYQHLAIELGNGADESCAGELHLFNPASTTFAKHFHSKFSAYEYRSQAREYFFNGYINDTTAIDEIQFKMDSGNFDGTIKMYGVK